MERMILVAVARTDLLICSVLPWVALILAVGAGIALAAWIGGLLYGGTRNDA